MRILQINKFYYLRGGAERYLFEIERVLEEKGHEVIPFSMHDMRNRHSPYSKYFVSNIDFRIPMSLGKKFKVVPRVLFSKEAKETIELLIEDTKPDVAHLHNIAHQISPSILFPLQKHNIPVVQTLHDYKLICPTYTLFTNGEICERCRGVRYYNVLLQRCNRGLISASLLNCIEMYFHKVIRAYDRVDLFISPSRFLKEKLIEHGIARERIVHLSNALRADEFSPQYNTSGYILYFGRISPEKGLLTLIQAMRSIPEIQLRIIGEGPLTGRLEHSIEHESVKNVYLMGSLHGEELNNTIRDSIFTVLPSEWYENYPYSILESFALGKPVVGSRIGGIPELIRHGETGLTFEAGNVEDLSEKIRELFLNPDGIVRMGMQARRWMEKESNVDTHYEDLMKMYEKAAGKTHII